MVLLFNTARYSEELQDNLERKAPMAGYLYTVKSHQQSQQPWLNSAVFSGQKIPVKLPIANMNFSRYLDLPVKSLVAKIVLLVTAQPLLIEN